MNAQPTLFALEQTETTSDDYYTPGWIFDALGLTFDLDVAAPPGGGPFVPCSRYFTIADDGLAQPWHGRVWMNPPYSNPTPWVERFIAHGDGVALLPTSNGRWFDLLWGSEATLTPLRSLRFYSPAGLMKAGIPNRVWLAGIGSECSDALRHVGPIR